MQSLLLVKSYQFSIETLDWNSNQFVPGSLFKVGATASPWFGLPVETTWANFNVGSPTYLTSTGNIWVETIKTETADIPVQMQLWPNFAKAPPKNTWRHNLVTLADHKHWLRPAGTGGTKYKRWIQFKHLRWHSDPPTPLCTLISNSFQL